MKQFTIRFSDVDYSIIREYIENAYPGITFSTALRSFILLSATNRVKKSQIESDRVKKTLFEPRKAPVSADPINDARASDPDLKKEERRKNKNPETAKKPASPKLAPLETSERILADLNKRAGTAYRFKGKAVRRLIALRLAEGYTEADFIEVNRKKCGDWLGGDMAKYLRPETLYGTKFEGYLGQLSTPSEPSGSVEPPKLGIYIAGGRLVSL